jgi:hypothetical protein
VVLVSSPRVSFSIVAKELLSSWVVVKAHHLSLKGGSRSTTLSERKSRGPGVLDVYLVVSLDIQLDLLSGEGSHSVEEGGKKFHVSDDSSTLTSSGRALLRIRVK